MIREEQIITACKGFLAAYPNIDQAGLSIGFLDGAVWSDKNPVNVWHDASEEPQYKNKLILTYSEIFDCFSMDFPNYLMMKDGGQNKDFETVVLRNKISKWAYVNDLLPKQFGNSEQLKGGEK